MKELKFVVQSGDLTLRIPSRMTPQDFRILYAFIDALEQAWNCRWREDRKIVERELNYDFAE